MPLAADETLDCIGFFCPVPVMRAAEALGRLRPGQVLEMTSDDPSAAADVQRWVALAGHELVEIQRNGAVFRFVVRKVR